MWTGEQALPPGAAAQIFNLSRGSFARKAKPQNPADSAPPATPPVSAEILWISGRGNCKEAIFALGNGISRRKNQLRLRRARRFCRFSNRQNRSALADLKTPWVFNLPVGVDFTARGLRPFRTLPGGQTGCLSLKKWGFISESTASLPGTFFSRGLWPSRALSADWQTGVFFRETILTRGLRLFRIFLRFGQTKRPRKPFAEALQTVWKNCASSAFGVTARPSGQAASATRRCP